MHFILTGELQIHTLSLYPVLSCNMVLDEVPHEPYPVPIGTVGTVEGDDDECEILISWNDERKLELIPGMDKYHVMK